MSQSASFCCKAFCAGLRLCTRGGYPIMAGCSTFRIAANQTNRRFCAGRRTHLMSGCRYRITAYDANVCFCTAVSFQLMLPCFPQNFSAPAANLSFGTKHILRIVPQFIFKHFIANSADCRFCAGSLPQSVFQRFTLLFSADPARFGHRAVCFLPEMYCEIAYCTRGQQHKNGQKGNNPP